MAKIGERGGVLGIGRRRRRLAGCALLAAAAVWLAGCGALAPADPGGHGGPQHVAVIDAGSSGSRLFLYRIRPDGGFVQVDTLFSSSAAPHPLAWYDGTHGPGSEPERAGPEGMGPLLQGLHQALRGRGLEAARTPVHALATAGVRLLPAESASQIHASVRAAIAAQGFPAGEVGTLSGQREGLYSWADANYLLGRFREGGGEPVGIVEVGGASAQVAFVAGAGAPPQAVVHARVLGRDYPVLSVSYLGLGQNEALQAMQQDTAGGPQAGACHPAGAPVEPPGRYRFGACAQAYAQVLQRAGQGGGAPQALPALRQVPGFASTQFLGVAAVRYAYGDWGLAAPQGAAPDDALARVLEDHCSGPGAWARVQSRYANPSITYRTQACAHGTYLHGLLFGADGLGLAGRQLQATGPAPQWTRGLVVLQSGAQAP